MIPGEEMKTKRGEIIGLFLEREIPAGLSMADTIVAIREQGGVKLNDAETIMPDPILVGRNPAKLEHLVERSGISNWTTNLCL